MPLAMEGVNGESSPENFINIGEEDFGIRVVEGDAVGFGKQT